MAAKLKSCPFCGCRAERVNSMTSDGRLFSVRCGDCLVDAGERWFRNEADAAWNRRSKPKATEEN